MAAVGPARVYDFGAALLRDDGKRSVIIELRHPDRRDPTLESLRTLGIEVENPRLTGDHILVAIAER